MRAHSPHEVPALPTPDAQRNKAPPSPWTSAKATQGGAKRQVTLKILPLRLGSLLRCPLSGFWYVLASSLSSLLP